MFLEMEEFSATTISISDKDINWCIAYGRQRVIWLNLMVEDWIRVTGYNGAIVQELKEVFSKEFSQYID
jgi:hypothetical protein